MVGINFRIYRAAFAPALAMVVVLLFSLQGRPAPLPPVVASAEFDEHAAAKIDRQIVDAAPIRAPGSEGDGVAADLVAEPVRKHPRRPGNRTAVRPRASTESKSSFAT